MGIANLQQLVLMVRIQCTMSELKPFVMYEQDPRITMFIIDCILRRAKLMIKKIAVFYEMQILFEAILFILTNLYRCPWKFGSAVFDLM